MVRPVNSRTLAHCQILFAINWLLVSETMLWMLLNMTFSKSMVGGFGRSIVGGEGKSTSRLSIYSSEIYTVPLIHNWSNIMNLTPGV